MVGGINTSDFDTVRPCGDDIIAFDASTMKRVFVALACNLDATTVRNYHADLRDHRRYSPKMGVRSHAKSVGPYQSCFGVCLYFVLVCFCDLLVVFRYSMVKINTCLSPSRTYDRLHKKINSDE